MLMVARTAGQVPRRDSDPSCLLQLAARRRALPLLDWRYLQVLPYPG